MRKIEKTKQNVLIYNKNSNTNFSIKPKEKKKIKKFHTYQRIFSVIFIKSKNSVLKKNLEFLSKKVMKNTYNPVLNFSIEKKKTLPFDLEKFYENERNSKNEKDNRCLNKKESCKIEGIPNLINSKHLKYLKNENLSIESPCNFIKDKINEKKLDLKKEGKENLKNNWLNLKKIFKYYSKDEIKIKNFRTKLNIVELKILKNLFDLKNFNIKLNNYEFLIKKGIKNLHKKILHQKYHKQNMNFTKKLFKFINQKIFNNFIDKIGRSLYTKTDFENFLNYYFQNPNKDLNIIITLVFFEYKKKESYLLFSYNNFKIQFFSILMELKNDKWISFESALEICLEKGFDDEGIKKIRYLFSDYILVCYNMDYLGNLYNKV